MSTPTLRPILPSDRVWLADALRQRWGSSRMVSRGVLFDVADQSGFLALLDRETVGVAAYHIEGDECELRLLEAFTPEQGVGSALVEAVKDAARAAGCQRLWLITTNDNTRALRFYQKRGFRLAALHRNAVTESRRLKPEIPLTGEDGIPITDELELELTL